MTLDNKKTKENKLFNRIAPAYGLFYSYQLNNYRRVIAGVKKDFDVSAYNNIVDIGSGTGALCRALMEEGLQVVGVVF